MYAGLICEKESLREWIQTSIWIGACIGPFFTPTFSNYAGRKKTFIISLLIGFLASLLLMLGIFWKDFLIIILANLLLGMISSGSVTLTFIISTEYLGESMRQKCLVLCNSAWPLASMSFILIFNYLPQWHFFILFFLVFPTVIALLFSILILVESPIFLLA